MAINVDNQLNSMYTIFVIQMALYSCIIVYVLEIFLNLDRLCEYYIKTNLKINIPMM